MQYIKQLAILNASTYIFAFVISMLGQTGAIGNYTMAEISAKYESGITPASFTFSIWSIVYLSLFIMVVFHLIQAFRKNENYITNKEIPLLGVVFAVNQLAISLWVYTWLNDMSGISFALLLIQLFTLYVIDRRLQMLNPKKGKISLFITQLSLSIYFGWITIATLANFAAWLVSLGWLAGDMDLYLSYALLSTAIVVGSVVVYFKHNIFFGLVIIWAIYGVIMKRFEVGNEFFYSLVYLGAFGIIIVLLAIIKTVLNYADIKEKPYLKNK
ncbi:hypothetical protein [Olivibacter domesticus]|uniref:TspO and MBR related proteins n=1 Tax=Olivibacter domesticus TaxID=407022 RepID=A0A1H7PS58_OLID1|nr:hypothetical protein [Olivibacter domesticus]SEL38602.1 hypothetical protein SAMN05661044_02339 [Olivibacter domesticus]